VAAVGFSALAAIFKRLQDLSHGSDDFAERQAIEDALHGLRVLQRDELAFLTGKRKPNLTRPRGEEEFALWQ